MGERSPSQLLAVTLPLRDVRSEGGSVTEEGISTFSVTGGTGAIDTTAGNLATLSSTGVKEMEERSPSQLLAVTLPLVL
jgi:hypothetical protein